MLFVATLVQFMEVTMVPQSKITSTSAFFLINCHLRCIFEELNILTLLLPGIIFSLLISFVDFFRSLILQYLGKYGRIYGSGVHCCIQR